MRLDIHFYVLPCVTTARCARRAALLFWVHQSVAFCDVCVVAELEGLCCMTSQKGTYFLNFQRPGMAIQIRIWKTCFANEKCCYSCKLQCPTRSCVGFFFSWQRCRGCKTETTGGESWRAWNVFHGPKEPEKVKVEIIEGWKTVQCPVSMQLA